MSVSRSPIMAAALSLFTTAAIAQQAGSSFGPQPGLDTAHTLQEIVVTAEKRSESIQKVPLDVTVLDQTKLTQMGATSLVDYANTIPSLSMESLAPGEQQVFLRGVTTVVDTSTRGSTQSTTGIYIDDMIVSNNVTAPDLDLFDVNRIEVLKGPQGTLYGDGSVGGLVRVITNKADPRQFSADLQATGGSIEHGGGDYGANAMANVPLVSDKLALRVVGQYRHNDGFIDDVVQNRRNVNSMTQWGGRASLAWDATARLNVTLNALYQGTALGAQNDYNLLLGDLKRGTIYPEPLNTIFKLYNATIKYDFGWSQLLSTSSYSTYYHRDDTDFTDFLATILPVTLPSLGRQGYDSRSVSEEMRLTSENARKLSWLLGLYYFRYKESNYEHDVSHGLFDFFSAIGEPLQGTPFDVGPDVIFNDNAKISHTEYAGFGELTYHLARGFSATVGGRYFSDKLENQDDAGGVVSGSPPTDLRASTNDTGSVYRFRLADQINARDLVYVLASEGYRIGGLNPLNPFTINDPTYPRAFQPDHLWNYEAGVKTGWLDGRLTIDGAAYHIDWQNMQIEVTLPTGFSEIANAGAASITGTELDVAYVPADWLALGINGSLIDAQLAKTSAIGEKGERLVGVPHQQGSAYVQGTFPMGSGMSGFVRLDADYMGTMRRFFGALDNFETYGNYTLANFRTGLRRGDLSVTLFVSNLADRRAALFTGQQSTTTPTGRLDRYTNQPRTVGITVEESF
jgi:iron complex outermembrane recepter protein